MIELFDFQKKTVEEILAKIEDNQLRAGVFAEMGTGKTPISMAIINRLKTRHLFIVCPQDSITAWQGALEKFELDLNYEIFVFDKPARVTHNIMQRLIHLMTIGQPFLVIFTYLGYSASVRMQNLMAPVWQQVNQVADQVGIVLDESHSIKNYKAKVTKQFLKLARKLEEVQLKLLLTGTPHPNFLYEIYTQLQFLTVRPISYCPSFWSFYTLHTEIIDKDNFRVEIGNRLEDKAMNEIKKYAVYLAKNDVLDALNLDQLQSTEILVDMSERNKELYQMAKHLVDITNPACNELNWKKLKQLPTAEMVAYLHGNKSRALSDMRQVIADCFEEPDISAKIPVLRELLSDGKPTIVYTPFIRSIEKLEKEFSDFKPLVITGSRAIPQDIETNIRPVLLATQSKLKQGLNLQGYKRIVYFSNDWSLINRMQSEARIHRFGQKDEIQIINLVYRDTIEERIVALLKNKQMANKIIIDLFKNDQQIDNFN